MGHYKWTPQFVLKELPMVEGWVWYSYAMSTDGWLNFSGVRLDGLGYIGQEKKELIKIAKDAWRVK